MSDLWWCERKKSEEKKVDCSLVVVARWERAAHRLQDSLWVQLLARLFRCLQLIDYLDTCEIGY